MKRYCPVCVVAFEPPDHAAQTLCCGQRCFTELLSIEPQELRSLMLITATALVMLDAGATDVGATLRSGLRRLQVVRATPAAPAEARRLKVDLPLSEIPAVADHTLRRGQLYRVIGYDLTLQQLQLERIETGDSPEALDKPTD